MMVRARAAVLVAAGALVASGCASPEPSPSRAAVIRSVLAGTRHMGIELSWDQGACIVGDAHRIGGDGALRQLVERPDLRGLEGGSGRAVAQAYGGCVGADFVDVWGYEP